MQKPSFVCLFLSITGNIYSQSDSINVNETIDKNKLSYISYYVTTDVLTIMNSLLSDVEETFTFTGEACLNHVWGFILNTGLIKEGNINYKRSGFSLSPELRWYQLKEDCSAPHIGVYVTIEETGYTYYDHGSVPPSHKCKEIIAGTGLSAGYKLLLNERWVIDPVAYIGISNCYRRNILEGQTSSFYFKDSGMSVRITLQAGYRF